MPSSEQLTVNIPDNLTGQRLDQALAQLFPDYSRARLQQWIKNGQVLVNGEQRRSKDKVVAGQQVTVEATSEEEVPWVGQDLPLEIVYEDEQLLVVNKPVGMVVHPAAGNPDGTLVNALLHYAPELSEVPRGGIIHRLDKDTSGLLAVARNLKAQKYLVDLLQARDMKRQYQAVVCGVMPSGGSVDAPIARHPVDRKRMAVVRSGKPAVTHYRVIERFRAHSHLRIDLETGRTHQIRVHMAHIHYPLVGDPVYGQRLRIPPDCTPALAEVLRSFKRQALHAARLGLVHPVTGEAMEWQAPLPEDMQHLVNALHDDMSIND